ncbi:Gastrula zinc finger protein XlCGF26.1 [Frankliniella fusca]|uniref:Gastrula zinc finger protein XlCGF26.1 n=1 Tax=Frankliniella fusca TaxID=407009 RepID=A0AAE1I3E9_9NEOP|nr:Gastrula zinc finger protein XlCGF26.1 [Frankliniella fusca]
MSSQVNSVLSVLDSNQQVVINSQQITQHQVSQFSQEYQCNDSKIAVMPLKGVKILKEKQTGKISDDKSEWNEESSKKWSNQRSAEMEGFVEDGDVEVLFLEDSSLASTAVQTLNKGKGNQVDENTDEELEENFEKYPKRRRKKPPSPEKITTNVVEQVACYKCKFCLFLSLSQDAVAVHVQNEHASQVPNENNCSMQCPGCSNIFFSQKSLRVHLSEDHNVAQEELENILNSFKPSISSEKIMPDTLGNESKRKKDSTGNLQTLSIHSDHSNPSGEVQPKRSARISQRNSQNTPEKKAVRRHGSQTIASVKPPVVDETQKIRVRKMSSLEKSEQVENCVEFVEIDSSKLGSLDELPSGIHILENQTDVGSHEQIHMEDIQYDIDSMQILDIPLGQQPIDAEGHLIQELSEQSSACGKTLQSVVVEGGHRYTVSASPTSCEAVINEICQEEVLDNVLYFEGGDDRDSPLMVCFAASPDDFSGNEDGYDVEVREEHSNSASLGNPDSERVILSSCSYIDGSGLVGSDGKKLVKRGFVKRLIPKKNGPRKPRNIKRKPVNAVGSGGEPTSAGYRCNVHGCTVRLLSHDNMEYHRRSHTPSHVPENALKITSGERENSSEPKRGRFLKTKLTFTCPECSIELETWKRMKGHLWKLHSVDMELYSCDQCGYKTPSLSNLNNIHSKIHGTEKPFLCDTCGKGFKTTKQLRNHKIIHVRKDGPLETCEICCRTFGSNRMLRNHINTVHNKVRPYMCSECGHTAANRSSLKMHLRQHTGDRPYGCDQCDYTTADHNSLRRHKKRHTGDKPYKCPYCPYACIQSTTFKIHLRTKHPGQDSDLMFSCKKCRFHSVSRDMYLSHVAEHDLSEACGIPFKPATRPSKRRPKRLTQLDEEPVKEIPIFVSIATDDAEEESEQQNFENIVQHVSEAIEPGSNLHVLYNSISVQDSNMKNSIIQIIDEESELEMVAEVSNADAVIEMPSEELEKLQDKKRARIDAY